MKRKGAKMRKGKKIRVEIVYIPKSKWPKKVLEKLKGDTGNTRGPCIPGVNRVAK